MNYTSLASAFDRGELNFDIFMEIAVEPEKFVIKPAKRQGRKAAAAQGALVSNDPELQDFADIRAAAPLQSSLTDEQGPFVPAPSNLRTAQAALKFILGGNAYFTVRSLKTGTRYTFRVSIAPKKEGACSWCHSQVCKCTRPYFVSFLSGPENTVDYTYLGWIKNYQFDVTRKSERFKDSTVFKAFRYIFEHLVRRELPPQTKIWHEGRCGVCGRPLTVPESIESGIGPVCAGKEGM